MPFTFTPAVIFPLSAVFQALLTITVLQLRPSHNPSAVRCLQGLLFVCALLLTDYSLVISGFYQQYPAVAGLSVPLSFALGPLLLAYVRCLLGKQGRRHSGLRSLLHSSLHFAAIPLCAVLLSPFYLSAPATKAEFFAALLSTGFEGPVFMALLVCLLMSLHLVLYCYCAYDELDRYDRALQQESAGEAVQIVQWLKVISGGFCLFQIAFYLAWAEWLYLHPEQWHYSYIAMYSLALMLVLIGLWGQLRPELFFKTTLADLPPLTPHLAPHSTPHFTQQSAPPEERYAKTRLEPAQLSELTLQLEAHMQSVRPFLDAELRLTTLAEQLAMTPHLLSQVINTGMQCNYFEYINRWRVRFAQSLLDALPDKENASPKPNLLKIALAAGFNSKATFNRSFRQETGLSPSDYLAKRKSEALPASVNR